MINDVSRSPRSSSLELHFASFTPPRNLHSHPRAPASFPADKGRDTDNALGPRLSSPAMPISTSRSARGRGGDGGSGPEIDLRTADDIPMELPDLARPNIKTLFEQADERQAQLRADKGLAPLPAHAAADSISTTERLADSFLVTLTLSMLHFTLDCLVYNQYRQDIVWSEIIARAGRLLPALWIVVYVFKTRIAVETLGVARQVLFMVAAAAAGSYLLHIGNTYDYYAVMKQAPPIGTLWIWSVYELGLGFALVSLAVNAGYAWWNGYSTF